MADLKAVSSVCRKIDLGLLYLSVAHPHRILELDLLLQDLQVERPIEIGPTRPRSRQDAELCGWVVPAKSQKLGEGRAG